MPIKLIPSTPEGTRVAAICDVCGDEITGGRMKGIYAWQQDRDAPWDGTERLDYIVAHTGPCAGSTRKSHPLFMHMEDFVIYLMNNLGFTPDDLKEREDILRLMP